MLRVAVEEQGLVSTVLEVPGLDQIVLGHPSYVWRFGQERRLDMIRSFIRLESSRILDIGCGLGSYVERFSDFTDDAYGIDIDIARIERGVAKGTDGLCAGASETLPYADDSFDAVVLNEVIEHVRDDRETIQEALRVTRPGGRVIIFAPNRFYPFETHGVYLGRKYVFGNIPLVNYLPNFLRRRLVPHARAYTRGRLNALTRGLAMRWVKWTVIYPGFDNILESKPALGRTLRRLFYTLEHSWLRRFGLSHLLVLEKTVRDASTGPTRNGSQPH
jgi:SAM-dependent methyltransferase